MSEEERIIEAMGDESRHRMAMLVLAGWKFTHTSPALVGLGISRWDAVNYNYPETSSIHDDPAAAWYHRGGTLKVLIDKIWFAGT